jgi:hypothetical protein
MKNLGLHHQVTTQTPPTLTILIMSGIVEEIFALTKKKFPSTLCSCLNAHFLPLFDEKPASEIDK